MGRAGEESEGIDLDKAMASMSRDNLEMVLAICIHKYPDCYDILLNELRKPIDLSQLNIDDSIDALEDDPETAIGLLTDIIERANSFTDSDCIANAITILRSTTELISKNTDIIKNIDDSDYLKEFWVILEQAWESLFNKVTEYDKMKSLFSDLAAWRKSIVGCAGPIFDESLRALKARIETIRAERPKKRSKTEMLTSK
ncbi:hypothetical protein BVRB_030200 [Beta vulgaris subsp. vulgaris]|uniref:Uncharacterized protein n=1 Tax=Beta vulgaris subsp. vulgaris TaxID=3555 RepID=A0A0J8AXM4_BETVV|nr:hypothetical protein BVRB_030200 [Beta vulgaris subsp. vulgaris]